MDRQEASATALHELELMLLDETVEPRALQLSLLEYITYGFSKDLEIGSGGFASVYQGILENGTVVAVKRLTNPYLDDTKFMREVECLIKVKNKNIVRFLGYCDESRGNVRSHNGKLVMAGAQERLLCFEFLSKGCLRNYIITDVSCNLEWRKCYEIIKGICQGLHYLHENNIVHLDLKPENVLLDEHMVPKIADFGLSRCFEEKQTSQSITSYLSGTLGYIAPELHNGEKITIKSDIYSLGIIIKEILTGKKGDPPTVESVLESWKTRLVEDTEFEQVLLCTEIGIKCGEFNPGNRPDIQAIIKRLQETEPEDEVRGFDVRPRVLYFPCAPITLIPSSLYLTNNTDEHVAFRLVENPKIHVTCCFEMLPLYGIVAPRSTYSLVVTTDKPKEKFIDLILESCTLGEAHMMEVPSKSMLAKFFEKTKEVDNMVQKVSLKAVANAQPDMISKRIPSETKILFVQKAEEDKATCFHVNPIKDWVITGHKKGFVRIWNYQTERKVHWFKVSNKTVKYVKFLEGKKWFVAASDDDFIHVYNYETKMHKITSFRGGSIVAVHPSKPYLLSASYNHRRGVVELRDWDKDWDRTQIFEIDHCGRPSQVTFNPKDTNTFAIAFEKEKLVEVRSVDSPRSKYTLCGHITDVIFLGFFKRDDHQYLITGSNDSSAKIWDMQNYMCICTVRVTSGVSLGSVFSFHPGHQILITSLTDGTLYLWSTTNFRLEQVINTSDYCSGDLWAITYSMRSTPEHLPGQAELGLGQGKARLLIGKGRKIAMLDTDNLNYKEESRRSSEPQFIADMRPGDTITTLMIPDDSEPLDVHPRELLFIAPCRIFYSPEPQIVHLTNNTDQHVAFRLLNNEGGTCFADDKLKQCGIIPSRCTYILVLTSKWLRFQKKTNFDLVLQSIVFGDNCTVPLENLSQGNELFNEIIEMTGNKVHEVAVRVVSNPHGEVTNEIFASSISIPGKIMDVHPTETWVLTRDGPHKMRTYGVWSYGGMGLISKFKVEPYGTIECAKFIGRMQWIVVGTSDGFIHVYTYERLPKRRLTDYEWWSAEEMTIFKASTTSKITLIAIHPTQPYLVSSDKDSQMKLWNWDVVKGMDWECTQTYDVEHSDGICELTFNPLKDTISFASASRDHTIKVWSLDSPKSNYTLFGHLGPVNCIDFFTRDDEQYLVSGSDDRLVRIWDLQKRACVHTIDADLLSPVFSVTSLPDHPYLLIGLGDGTVHLFSSAHFRSERIIGFTSHISWRSRVVRLVGSRRIVIGHTGTNDSVLVMDVEKLVTKPGAIEDNNKLYKDMDNFSAHTGSGGTTSQIIMEAMNRFLLQIYRWYEKLLGRGNHGQGV